MKYRYYTFFLALLFTLPAFSQSKKDLRKNNVASQTVKEYFVEEGLKDPVTESMEFYDKEGNVVERKEFNSEGELKKWQKFVYDEDDNKTEELTLDSKGKQEEKVVWVYENGLLKEKKYFDNKNRLTKRKEYLYEFREE